MCVGYDIGNFCTVTKLSKRNIEILFVQASCCRCLTFSKDFLRWIEVVRIEVRPSTEDTIVGRTECRILQKVSPKLNGLC